MLSPAAAILLCSSICGLEWDYFTSMETKRSGHAALVLNGTIYVIGGRDGSNALSSGEKYNATTGVWTPIAPMGTERHLFAAAVLNDFIYIMGGRRDNGNYLSSAEQYNPTIDAWTPVATNDMDPLPLYWIT